jgi:nitrilase
LITREKLGCHNLSATHAIEDGCSVVLAFFLCTQADIEHMQLGEGELYYIGGSGCVCIIGQR